MNRNRHLAVMLTGVVIASLAIGGRAGASTSTERATSVDDAQIAQAKKTVRDAMEQYDLRASIVQVRQDGRNVYRRALGESMTGVRARADMHWRNGAVAFTYMGTILMRLVDQKELKLDDPLAKYLPDLPNADRITLEMLANMTSGYADYVYQPEVLDGVNLDPFRQWTSDELIEIGTSKPMMFEPGTNWGYSHTNFVILTKVFEKVTGRPMTRIMKQQIIEPLGLRQTASSATPTMPEPVLHGFSSERRESLGIAPGTPFYEESTFWNPSWTTGEGAVMYTDIGDVTKSFEALGSGKLLSKRSYRAQFEPHLIGFGTDDTPGCPVCHQNTEARSYGLGVILSGDWITQTKNFAGSGATVGYLPSEKLTISVVTNYGPGAFDDTGAYMNSSDTIFNALANDLAPNDAPPGA